MQTKLFILTILAPMALALTGCDKHEPATTPPAATNAASEKPMAPAEPPAMTPAPAPAPAPAPTPAPPVPVPNTNNPAVTNQ